MHPFFSRHKRTFLALIAAFLYAAAIAYATPPTSPYTPAETLDPTCAPGDINCSVTLFPDQTGNSGAFLTTNGTTVSWATIPASSNIYNTDGTLTGNRTLTLSGNTLDIAGTTTTRFFGNGNVAIGTTTDDGYKLRVQGNTRVSGQLTAVGSGMIGGVTQSDFSTALASTFQVNHSNGNYGLQVINSSTANSGANITLFKTRGGSVASALGSVVNQDRVGNIYFQAVAANGTSVSLSGKITVYAYPTGGFSYLGNGAVPPNSSVPGMFEFATTGLNGVQDVSRMRLLPDGELMLGDGSVQVFNNYYRLQVNGSGYYTGKLLVGAPFATTSIADSSAVLDIRGTTGGALLPRMTNAQRTAITTPATGLLAYSTDATEGLYVNLSGGWQRFLTTADIGTTITSDNIYNANGSLTGARTLTLSGNNLDIVGTTTTRFAANGDVGIGTTSPSARLDVRVNSAIDGQYNLANFQRTGGSLGSQYISIGDDTYAGTVLGQNGGNGGAYQYGSYLDTFLVNKYTAGNLGSLLLGTNNIVRMTITHNGNVGIGTQSPGALFGIAGDSVDFLRFDYGASASAYNLKLTQIVEPADVYWSFVQRNVNTDYNVLAFRQGNVGIGTTANSGFKFDVNGTGRFSGDVTMVSNKLSWGTNFSANSILLFDNGSTSDRNGVGNSSQTGGLALFSRGGGILIGNDQDATTLTSSNAQIAVTNSLISFNKPVNMTDASGNAFYLGGTFSTRNGLGISAANSAVSLFAGTGNNLLFGIGQDGTTLTTANSKMTIWSATGNVGIGTTTDAGYKLDVNGAARVTTDNPIRFDPATNQYGLAIQPGSAGPSRLYATTNGGVSPLQAFEFGFFTTSLNSSSGFSDPSGNNVSFRLYGTQTAGGAGGGSYTDFLINPTINMAGNANPGVYRGINFQPTLTDITNTTIFAFRNTVGNNVFNTTSGNTLIGTETDNGFKLQVNGTARTYGELSAWGGGFRLNRNGAEPYFAFHYNESQVAQIRSMADGTLRFTDGGGGASRIEVSPSTFKSFTSLTTAKTNLGGGGSGTPSVGIYHGTAFTPDGYFSTLFLRNTNAVEMIDGFGVGVDFQIEDSTQGPIAVGSVGAVRMGADNSGALIFRTTNAGSLLEKARITNDGNLLVGTVTNSGFKLDVNGSTVVRSTSAAGFQVFDQYSTRNFMTGTESSGGIQVGNQTLGSGSGRWVSVVQSSGSTNAYGGVRFFNTDDQSVGIGSIGFNGNNEFQLISSASEASLQQALRATANAVYLGYNTYSSLPTNGAFVNYGRTNFFNANSGSTVIGATSDSGHKLQVTGTVSLASLTVAGSSQDALCITNGGTEVQRNNGAQTCTVSSARFKHDIQPLSGDILNTLSQFTPSTFIYNDQTNLRIGLIAEEVFTIDPRLVFYEADGITPRGVRYEDLSVMTLKGVQELIVTTTTLNDLTKENTLRAQLSAWLGDVANGLENITAGRVRARQEVCIDDVCINKDQLRQLIQTQTAQPPQQDTLSNAAALEEEKGVQETIDTPLEIEERATFEEDSTSPEGSAPQ